MLSEQRAAIAAIVIAINSEKSIKSVYSYEKSKYISLSGSASANSISAYDYSRSCYISGNASSIFNYNLYDYGLSSHLNLKFDNGKFSGYDYNSGFHFTGTVKSLSVTLYDYQSSSYYNFSS